MPANGLQPVNQRLIRDDVLSSLRAAILDGTLQAGERLIETDLAEQLGTSRGPVRDALQELAREGLVEISPYKGAVVATFTGRDVQEIYELRSVLEGHATRLAVENATLSDLDHLQRIYDEMQTLADDDDLVALVEKDVEFHREICRLSGNQRLFQVWSSLASQVRLLAVLAHQVFVEPDLIVETHTRTMEAMHNRDPEWAEAAVKESILEVGQAIAKAMDQQKLT